MTFELAALAAGVSTDKSFFPSPFLLPVGVRFATQVSAAGVLVFFLRDLFLTGAFSFRAEMRFLIVLWRILSRVGFFLKWWALRLF